MFGPFTGGVHNPEAQFAQFTARAAAGASTMRVSPSNSPVPPPNPPPDPRLGPSSYTAPSASRERTSLPRPVEALGIDEEPLADSGGVTGIKVSSVHQGTVAERAGLHAGDVIYSANGYLTTDPGNLAWIIATKAPGGTLSMNVRRAADHARGEEGDHSMIFGLENKFWPVLVAGPGCDHGVIESGFFGAGSEKGLPSPKNS